MMVDFEKATEVAMIEIGVLHMVTGSVDLPKGNADIRFVVHDFDCKQPLRASINIELQFADGTKKQRAVKLDDLTWPTSGQDCRPIGYLRLDDPKYTRPFRFVVDLKSNPVKFSITVTNAADAGKQVGIWVVYNDREPVERMLRKKK